MGNKGTRVLGLAFLMSYLVFLFLFSTSYFVQEVLSGGIWANSYLLRG